MVVDGCIEGRPAIQLWDAAAAAFGVTVRYHFGVTMAPGQRPGWTHRIKGHYTRMHKPFDPERLDGVLANATRWHQAASAL